ncbi:hypothetical protein FACS1894142_3840 [Spirochaetia bacterium]|nr:hypothetical protein FACS1894142_3840 [Spirochaetia bacterium]
MILFWTKIIRNSKMLDGVLQNYVIHQSYLSIFHAKSYPFLPLNADIIEIL